MYCRPRMRPTSRSSKSNTASIAPDRNRISPITMNSGTVASAVVVAVVKMLLANSPKPAGPISTRMPATFRMRNATNTGMPRNKSAKQQPDPAAERHPPGHGMMLTWPVSRSSLIRSRRK